MSLERGWIAGVDETGRAAVEVIIEWKVTRAECADLDEGFFWEESFICFGAAGVRGDLADAPGELL